MAESATTAKLASTHKYWKCKQDFINGNVCGETNDMDVKQCKSCKAKRDVGDEALNSYGAKLGKLVQVNRDGTERWEYD
ncbi:Ff.00g004760.m01.CDS01 [Fusarium sp. VM40]|nr:Ff.00g004760.m01.CDS01 [Fusarium sp. VM40]